MNKESELESLDEAILLEISCEEPWHLICGSFSQEVGGPRQLAARLFAFQQAGWLTITNYDDGGPAPSIEALGRHAEAHDNYADNEYPDDYSWSLECTARALDLLLARGKLV
jgi:hypothetical protein